MPRRGRTSFDTRIHFEEESSRPFGLIEAAFACAASSEVPRAFNPFTSPNTDLEAFTTTVHRTQLDFEFDSHTGVLATT